MSLSIPRRIPREFFVLRHMGTLSLDCIIGQTEEKVKGGARKNGGIRKNSPEKGGAPLHFFLLLLQYFGI